MNYRYSQTQQIGPPGRRDAATPRPPVHTDNEVAASAMRQGLPTAGAPIWIGSRRRIHSSTQLPASAIPDVWQ